MTFSFCCLLQIKDGTALLLEVLQNPALQKTAKVWYMLQAQVLQLTATYLSLPPSHLSPEFRQYIFTQGEPPRCWKRSPEAPCCGQNPGQAQSSEVPPTPLGLGRESWVLCQVIGANAHSCSHAGWKTPETALSEAHRLLRDIVLLLMGSNVLGSHKSAADIRFIDCGEWMGGMEGCMCSFCLAGRSGFVTSMSLLSGDNVLQKWQVLADLLGCSEHLVVLLSGVEVMCKAKAFCLEAIKLAVKLQAVRW